MNTPPESSFEGSTMKTLAEMKDLHGTFEGHRIHLYVEGFASPKFEPRLTGAFVVAIGSQFVLKFGTITMNLPVSKDWEQTFTEFNASTNIFEVIGYEKAK